MDTTIKVSTDVRDRLAVLAADRGTTIRGLVDQLATASPTQAELHQRQKQAAAYVQTHLRPDFGDLDIEAGHQIWDALPVNRSTDHDRREAPDASGSGGQAT